ncbi:MAG: hypothetical protein IKU32_05895 [Clostridia bacterium]|nr:hypothetical protein [Clostridia bacterium]
MKKTGILLIVVLLTAILFGCTLPPGAVRYKAAKQYEFNFDEHYSTIYGTVFRKPLTINVGEEDVVDLIDCVFKDDIIINAKAGSAICFLGMCRFKGEIKVIFNQASENMKPPRLFIPYRNIAVETSGTAIVVGGSDVPLTVNGKEYTLDDCSDAVIGWKWDGESFIIETVKMEEGKEYPEFSVYCRPDSEPSVIVTADERIWNPIRKYPHN